MKTTDIKIRKEKEFKIIHDQFKDSLFKEFKMERLNYRLKEWYKLDWPEFKKEILKSGEKLNYPKQVNWERYFKYQKEKALNLSREIKTYKYKLVEESSSK